MTHPEWPLRRPMHCLASRGPTCTDFPGSPFRQGWDVFSGVPAGCPDGHFGTPTPSWVGEPPGDPCAFRRSAISGSPAGMPVRIGADLRRLLRAFETDRVPGSQRGAVAGPPVRRPPEIDFYESGGEITSVPSRRFTTASRNNIEQRSASHRHGQVATPCGLGLESGARLTYTVDGQAWGTVTLPREIPGQPMTLHLQQQASCASWAWATGARSAAAPWRSTGSPSTSRGSQPRVPRDTRVTTTVGT